MITGRRFVHSLLLLALSAAPAVGAKLPSYEELYPLKYTLMDATWAFQVAYTHHSIGPRAEFAKAPTSFQGVSVGLEYVLPQSTLGILSLGGNVGAYTAHGERSPFNGSFGVALRYQLILFRNQFLVPSIAAAAEFWRFTLPDAGETTGNVWIFGPVLGVALLLNALDRGTATAFYADKKVLRTYLLAEARYLKGRFSTLSFEKPAYYLGLRFEW